MLVKVYLSSRLIVSVFTQADENFINYIILLLVVFLVFGVLQILQNKMTLYLKINMIVTIQKNILDKILNTKMQYINLQPQKGAFISIITNDATQTVEIFLNEFIPAVCSLLNSIILIIVMFKIEPILSIIVLIMLPMIVLVYKKKGKSLKENQLIVKEKKDVINSNLIEIMTYLKNIKILNLKVFTNSYFTRVIDDEKNAEKNLGNIVMFYGIISILMTTLVESTIFFVGGIMAIKGSLAVDMFISFNNYYQQFYSNINKMFKLIPSYQKMMISLKRIFDITNSGSDNYDLFGDKELYNIDKIELKNINFSYGNNIIFEDVNLNMDSNGIYGIVGKSGIGKTTLINILSQIYYPTSGEILINSNNVLLYNERTIRKNIVVLSQEHYILRGKIIENFLAVNNSLELKDIIEICKDCNIHEFIDQLPNKYDTIIDEGAFNLSEGQKQRIAIARAISVNSSVLILDEPTSALDIESTNTIRNTLNKLKNSKKIIMVTHDFSNLYNVNKIFEIKDKKIKEIQCN